MFAAQISEWDVVMFLLDHGVRPDVVAPDGTSLRTIVAEKKAEGAADSSFAAVVRKLEAGGDSARR